METISVQQLQIELYATQDIVEGTHHALDRLHVPRDMGGYNRNLTPYGRLALLQANMPELWKYIQDEIDKYMKGNS